MDKIDLIIDALESAHHTNDTGVMGLTKSRLDVALAAARELIAQPEQKLIGWKDGEPQYVEQPEQAPKLSDAGADTNIVRGLEPKGKGMVTLNNPKGKSNLLYVPPEPTTLADIGITSVQPNPEHQPWCDYLNIMLTSMPPQRAKCNCKTAQPEPKSISTNDHLCSMLRQVHDVLACTALPMKRPWVGLTDIDIHVLKMNHDKVKVVYTDHAKDLSVLGQDVDVNGLINAIQNKLKELNT